MSKAKRAAFLRRRRELGFSVRVVGGVTIKRLPQGSHKACGSFANIERLWYPNQEYMVGGAFRVAVGKKLASRMPSLRKNMFIRHWYTYKYAGLLARYRPDLYIALQGLDPDGEAARRLNAHHIALKLRGEL